MKTILRPSAFALLCAAFTLSLTSSGLAGVVVQKDFTRAEGGVQSDLSEMSFWTGDPVNSWGEIALEALPAGMADSPKNALKVVTNPAAPAAPDGSKFAPLIEFKTPGFGSAENTKKAVYLLRFFVPVDGNYRTDIHFGGNWDSNAAILVLGKNTINAMEQGTPTKVCDYSPMAWQDLQVEFDCVGKTYSIFMNGKKAANAVPWNNPKLSSIESLSIIAGAMPVERDRTPVLYIEKIDISGN